MLSVGLIVLSYCGTVVFRQVISFCSYSQVCWCLLRVLFLLLLLFLPQMFRGYRTPSLLQARCGCGACCSLACSSSNQWVLATWISQFYVYNLFSTARCFKVWSCLWSLLLFWWPLRTAFSTTVHLWGVSVCKWVMVFVLDLLASLFVHLARISNTKQLCKGLEVTFHRFRMQCAALLRQLS